MESRQEILARTRKRINAAKSRKSLTWQDVFGKCDKDGSGYLDMAELTDAVRNSLHCPENAICDYELRTLFTEMDSDKSGGVNMEELLNYLQQGYRTPEEIAARGQVRIQRVRKNLKTSFQSLASSESALRKLFQKLDMDSDCMLSLYEFKTFVRGTLKLSFWDVCNTDIEDFFRYLDKDGHGISVDELIAFVKSNHMDRPKEFSFIDLGKHSSLEAAKKRQMKKKTYKQTLLEDSFRSTSLPNLSRMPYTPSVVSRGRAFAPTDRSTMSLSAQMFFNPGRLGS